MQSASNTKNLIRPRPAMHQPSQAGSTTSDILAVLFELDDQCVKLRFVIWQCTVEQTLACAITRRPAFDLIIDQCAQMALQLNWYLSRSALGRDRDRATEK